MDHKEFSKYFKACEDANISIYPKPSNVARYKIIINTRGKEKEGSEFYQDKESSKNVVIKTTKGLVNVSQKVPSVWDKIRELYKEICIKNKLLEL
jgi:hypothetical protein